jgi:hypothetical protein
MIIENLSYGKNNNKINVDGYYYDGNSTLTLLTDGISSKSFNGIIPKVTKEVILYNKYTGSFNIKVGQEIGILEYDEVHRYYTILKIYTDENLKYFGQLNPQDAGMEDQDYFPEFTSNVFIDYLRSDGEILTYVIQTTLTDGFPDNLVQVSYEDWSSKSIGTSGWAITSQGNSIFNNVAVRGSIDAVDGNFSGALTVNNGEMKIGAGVSISTQYMITQYSSLNNIVTLTLDTVHPFQVGEKIIVSSLPSIDLSYINLNGTYTVSAIDTYTISYDFEQTIYPVYDNTETIIRDADIPDTIVTRGSVGSSLLSDGIHINDYNYWHSTGDILIGDIDSSFSWNSTTNQLVINGANVTIGGDVNIEATVTAESLIIGTDPTLLKISNNADGYGNNGIYVNPWSYWWSNGDFAIGDGSLGIAWTQDAGLFQVNGTIYATSGRIGITPGVGDTGWLIDSALLSNGEVGFYAPIIRSGTATITENADTSKIGYSNLSSGFIPLVGMSITGTGIASGSYITAKTSSVLTLSSPKTGTVSGTGYISEYAIYAGNTTRQLSPFKVDYYGNLVATSGVIGGWKIGATSLTAGTSTTSVGMNTTGYPFYAGNATPASAPFRVTSAGALTATTATITGTIYATSGYIGGSTSGWTITTNKFYNGKLTLNAPVSTATTGTGTVTGTANLYVVTLTSPTITPVIGMSITGTGIAPGAQINTVTGTGPYTLNLSIQNTATVSGTATISEIGIWAGATTGSSTFAPFRVDYSGNLYAESATIAGTINATGGTFTNKVTIGGAITGSLQVGTGTNKINIFGNLTDAGTYINTGTTTATTGSGFYLDASGRLRIAGTDSLTFDGTNLTITGTINALAGGTIGGFTMGATSLYGGTTPNIVGLIPGSTTTAIFAGATSNTGTGAVFKVTNAGVLTATNANISGAITATSGSFTGIVSIAAGGSLVAGNATDGVTISNTGLVGYDNGIAVFTIPTSAGSTPTIGNFKVVNTAILSDGANANLIIGTTGVSANNITLRGQVGTGIVPAIFTTISGTETSDSSGNGFYIDRSGKFRLAGTNGSVTMDGSGNLSVTGSINATGGVFTGYVQAGNTKFGSGVSGLNDGIFINDINYWYDNTSFRTGTYSAFMNWDNDRQTLGVRGTLKTKTGEIGGLNYGWLVGSGKIVGGGGASYMALQSGYYSTLATAIDDSSGSPSIFNPAKNYGSVIGTNLYGIDPTYKLAKISLSIYLAALAGDYVTFRNTDTDNDTNLQKSLRIMYVDNGSESGNPFIEVYIPPVTDWHYTDLAGPAYNSETKEAIVVIVEDEINYIIDKVKITYLGLDNGNGIYECEAYISDDDITGFTYSGTSPTQETITDNRSLKLLSTKEFILSSFGTTTDLSPLNDFNFFSEKNLYEEADRAFSAAFPGDGFLTYLDSYENSQTAPEIKSFVSEKKTISSIQKTATTLVINISSGSTTDIVIGKNITFAKVETSINNTALENLINHLKYNVVSKTVSSITVEIPSDLVSQYNTITNSTYTLLTGRCSKNIFTIPFSIRDHSFWVGNESPTASGFALDSYGNVTKINVHNTNGNAELKVDKLIVRDTGTVTNLSAEKVNGVKITSSSIEPTSPSTGDIWIVI